MSVALLEGDKLGRAASHVAAGMLAPVAELEFGSAARRSLELGLRAASAWPAFAAELARGTGTPVPLHTDGTLLLARDDDEARELQRQLELRRSLQLRVNRLLPSEAREREPALAPTLRAALECPEDHSVDPRQVLLGAGARVRARRALPCASTPLSRGSSCDRAGRARDRCPQRRRPAPRGRRGGAGGRCLERRAAGRGGRGADRRAAGEGPDHAAARSRGSRAAHPHGALRGRVSAAARRRPLRARSHRRGARLRADPDRRRRVRAAARCTRAGARGVRARARGGLGGAAPGEPRQRAADRPRPLSRA